MGRRSDQSVVVVELLRFVCAMAVMAKHYGHGFWRVREPRQAALLDGIFYRAPGESVFQFGWLGVEIFFVISGLMIARSAAGSDARGFIRRRVLRLAPAAWVSATTTLVALVAAVGISDDLLADWARSITFWPIGPQIDPSYWTLGIELAFYLVIAAFLGAAGSAQRIERTGAGIGLASGLFWVGCFAIGPAAGALPNDRILQLLLLPFGCCFALGIVIALWQADGGTFGRTLGLAALLAVCELEVTVRANQHPGVNGLPAAPGKSMVIFTAAVAVLILADRIQPALTRWIRPAAARTLGRMTYPLYLVHQQLGAVVVAVAVSVGAAPGFALLAAVAASLATAWLIMRAEPAVRNGLAHVLAGKRVAGVPRVSPSAD